MSKSLKSITDMVPKINAQIVALRELLLSNIVMISEISSPTGGEKQRAHFLTERFSENSLLNCSTDDYGNALGILNGSSGTRNILVVAHLDTNFGHEVDHTVHIMQDHICGVGVSDNSIGVAAIEALPYVLKKLDIKLKANLILMGTVNSLGSGNIAGIRSFLDNSSVKIDNAICVEGVTLGRLSVSSRGMLRGEITYTASETMDWTHDDSPSAIIYMNEIVNRILELPLPRRPRADILLNAFRSGDSFGWIPSRSRLRFEINSESERWVENLTSATRNICEEVTSRSGGKIAMDIIAKRSPGGMSYDHPLVKSARAILVALDAEPRILYSTSELSACIAHGIPAITIGITRSANTNTLEERVEIKPITGGLTQLIALLLAIDQGLCDES